MSPNFAGWDDATLELAADLVTEGLAAADQLDLDSRARQEDLEAFELAVAALALGGLEELEQPPREIRAGLDRAAQAWSAGQQQPRRSEEPVRSTLEPRPTRPTPVLALSGWLAAAALLALLLVLQKGGQEPSAVMGLDERCEALVGEPDLKRWDWAPGPASDSQVGGEVLWSSGQQEGYMRFIGLAANDPSVEQYQLWIFDPTRNDWEAKPVDGGVFDVGPSGEVIVPIAPKLEVRDAALFAITVEQPGGVVVSERERLILLAQAPS